MKRRVDVVLLVVAALLLVGAIVVSLSVAVPAMAGSDMFLQMQRGDELQVDCAASLIVQQPHEGQVLLSCGGGGGRSAGPEG